VANGLETYAADARRVTPRATVIDLSDGPTSRRAFFASARSDAPLKSPRNEIAVAMPNLHPLQGWNQTATQLETTS